MSADDPYILARATVASVERPSPTFARITFTGPGLDDFGTPGRTFDQRIKLIFPPESGSLPELDAAGGDWYGAWLAVPEERRGAMRTYSVRDVRRTDSGTTVVVDIVVHLAGSSGPDTRWAAGAAPGDEVLVVGPRHGHDGGGIEFDPGVARWVLLAGDETAAPAIARILEDAHPDTRGLAFIEVPNEADALPIRAPGGVEVRWLPRSCEAPGTALVPAVLGVVGLAAPPDLDVAGAPDEIWETPTYSGLGEEVPGARGGTDRYFWIAGESRMVTTLRRHLVTDLGIERSQVAFMGYWRQGMPAQG